MATARVGPTFVAAGVAVTVVVAIALAALRPEAPAASEPGDAVHDALMLAEDARGDASLLIRAVRHDDPTVRRRAIVALGRFEREAHIPVLEAALADSVGLLRAEAANAVAQAAYQRGAARAFAALRGRVPEESDPQVLGALARAMGRLRFETADELAAAEQAVLDSWSRGLDVADDQAAPPLALQLGVALGLEALSRRARVRPLGPDAVTLLGSLLTMPTTIAPGRMEAVRRTRVAAAAGLVAAAALDEAGIGSVLSSDDPQLRRIGAQGLARRDQRPTTLLDRVRRDPSPLVRAELARALAPPSSDACAVAASLLRDADIHVETSALDAVARVCVDVPIEASTSTRLAERAREAIAPWPARAHALVTWAKLAPEAAAPHLGAAAGSAIWQERMYAARAATATRDIELLARLAADAVANVQEAAVGGLTTLDAARAAQVAQATLSTDDYQLLLAATAAIAKGTAEEQRRERTSALLAVFARLSTHDRQTARDPRKAVLDAVRALTVEPGTPATPRAFVTREDATTLEPFVRDADPVVAELASALVSTWTGRLVPPAPRARAPRRVPRMPELRTLARTTAVMTLEGIGDVEFRLLAFDAPTNVARLADQARRRFFDGLTWHRVEPNFVLQGGSPGANEYSAEGPYTNDEITSASHLRGTIGISTRGRDTGDGQLFINLADNIRLDHNFTIVGEIVSGLELIDRVTEGTVITSIALREP